MAGTNKDSGFVDDWQKGKSVTECNLHMLETEELSDLTFRLGLEKHVVRAHRYVLVSRSCVFHAMFCGPMAEEGEITITDIEPEIFKDLLRYVYTDNVTINNDNVTGLLYTSRKYSVDGLFEECIKYYEKILSEDTACQIIEECHPYPCLDLMKKAFDILTSAGKGLIKTPGFLRLCHECLGKFLKSPNLKLKEEEVLEATMSWVREKCEVENVPVNLKNIQRFLGDLWYEIRFSAMSLDYLVNVVGPLEILTENERVKFMDKKFNPNIDISPFMPLFRNEYGRTKSVQRLLTEPDSTMATNCTHAVSFSASNTIVLKGIELYGPYSGTESKYTLSVDLFEEEGNQKCCSFQWRSMTLVKNVQNAITFPSDVLLKANTVYTLSVYIGGDVDTLCGSLGQQSVTVDEVVFRFSKSLTAGFSPTNQSSGQIPGLIVGIKDHECTTCRKCMHEKNKEIESELLQRYKSNLGKVL